MIHTDISNEKPTVAVTAERPQVLDLSRTTGSSLMTMGTATVLDLSNPTVVNSLATPSEFVITPRSEQNLLNLITSQGLSAISPSALMASSPITDTMTTFAPVVITMPEEEAEVVITDPSPAISLPASVTSESYCPRESMPSRSSVDTMDGNTMDSTDSGTSAELMASSSMDPSVARAMKESASSGTLTPLIKTELKYTIQNRRILAGKNELCPEELLERKDEQKELSPEEQSRRDRRRERNKVAAQKCRSRRREKASVLEEEVTTLEKSNEKLREEMEILEAEKEKLKRILLFHDDRQAKCPKRSRLSVEDTVEEVAEDDLMFDELEDGTFNITDAEIQIVSNLGKR